LQVRRDWTGPQLAERLEVTTRTVRNDVERLRRLGYPVHAEPGVAGGYRLGAGASLPPLLLDDEEAVAVAVGLRSGAGVTGIEETSARALAKLDQVLPPRLRRRVDALHRSSVAITDAGPSVDAEVLTALAAAVRDRELLRLRYGGTAKPLLTVEPHRLVHTRGRWYLVAWDEGWRLFEADRIRLGSHTGPRFRPRPDPGGDLAGHVERELGRSMWHYRARVKVHAPASRVAARVPPAVVVEAIGEDACFANVGSDSPHDLALWLALIDADFDAADHPELAAEVRELADRFARAVDSGVNRPTRPTTQSR
jgi:predicted DNA-binding transcriptional regulator YafY